LILNQKRGYAIKITKNNKKVNMIYSLLTCSIFAFILSSTSTFANPVSTTDDIIEKLYHSLPSKPSLTMVKRLDYFSQSWLGYPYELTSLGEGEPSKYDEKPRDYLLGFDCETFVDAVLAGALAENSHYFRQCLDKIRYQDGTVDFVHRNHFTSIDWNKNNEQQGFIEDITRTILNAEHQPVAIQSKTIIDKKSWYQKLSIQHIRLNHATSEEKQKRLDSLHHAGDHFSKQISVLDYIPLDILFNNDNQPNLSLFKQIPDGAIIEIVRPNWDLTALIGTQLDIPHLGFAIWKRDVLIFRQASSKEMRVIDVPLIDYLLEAKKTSPTTKGIHLLKIVPKEPLTQGC